MGFDSRGRASYSVCRMIYRSRCCMATVTVSPKYQVVIPSALRRVLGIRPGQKIEVLAYEGRMEFVPVRPMKSMRGFLPGLDTRLPREDDRV